MIETKDTLTIAQLNQYNEASIKKILRIKSVVASILIDLLPELKDYSIGATRSYLVANR